MSKSRMGQTNVDILTVRAGEEDMLQPIINNKANDDNSTCLRH